MAVSIHQIAGYLYKLDLSRHKDDATLRIPPEHRLPTFLYHRQYQDFDQYPDGVADAVGYWAEAEILGGVVLFDRRKPEPCEDVCLPPLYSLYTPTLTLRAFLKC